MLVRQISSHRSSLLAARARQMRCSLNRAEQALWRQLSGGKLGVGFRRQVVVGEFIVDFLAPGARLAMEVDGGSHRGRARADARRDRVLGRLGYRVLRLDAELVVTNPPEAVARIRAALSEAGRTWVCRGGPPRKRRILRDDCCLCEPGHSPGPY